MFDPIFENSVYGEGWAEKMIEFYNQNRGEKSPWDGLSEIQKKQYIRENSIHNFTCWFREGALLEVVRHKIIPSLISSNNHRKIRIASIGCSDGREIWSFLYYLWQYRERLSFSGFDVSSEQINEIADICYLSEDQRWTFQGPAYGTPDEFKEYDIVDAYTEGITPKHFTNIRGKTFWKIVPSSEAWKSVEGFFSWDIIDNPLPAGKYDIIICCNVLCHYEKKGKEMITANICSSLLEGGMVMFGNPYSYNGWKAQEYYDFVRGRANHKPYFKQLGLVKFEVSMGKFGWIDSSNTCIHFNSSLSQSS